MLVWEVIELLCNNVHIFGKKVRWNWISFIDSALWILSNVDFGLKKKVSILLMHRTVFDMFCSIVSYVLLFLRTIQDGARQRNAL